MKNLKTYVELCEQILALRQMSDPEIMATVSSVLKGPNKSWWIAEGNEECLRTCVQAPGETIMDFAYDYYALS